MVDSDWSEHTIYTKMYLIYYSLSWLKYISIRVKLAVKMFATHPIPVELNPVLNALNLIRWDLFFFDGWYWFPIWTSDWYNKAMNQFPRVVPSLFYPKIVCWATRLNLLQKICWPLYSPLCGLKNITLLTTICWTSWKGKRIDWPRKPTSIGPPMCWTTD